MCSGLQEIERYDPASSERVPFEDAPDSFPPTTVLSKVEWVVGGLSNEKGFSSIITEAYEENNEKDSRKVMPKQYLLFDF
ncbi:hypothetical protein CDAR_209631 [Caerostris darwini]|uniref:Uncharacterized protein n=1 Tax=Caerostris darwini TaxID=1538125 RepID=A0AAV4SXU2_9ARAC|nr:hypothetical protein CDAR_209631 [Caerostris darwini]